MPRRWRLGAARAWGWAGSGSRPAPSLPTPAPWPRGRPLPAPRSCRGAVVGGSPAIQSRESRHWGSSARIAAPAAHHPPWATGRAATHRPSKEGVPAVAWRTAGPAGLERPAHVHKPDSTLLPQVQGPEPELLPRLQRPSFHSGRGPYSSPGVLVAGEVGDERWQYLGWWTPALRVVMEGPTAAPLRLREGTQPPCGWSPAQALYPQRKWGAGAPSPIG